ncbi:MAG: acyl-CoA dehydrogenase family protein, partial [Pseudomonadota bacterium]
MNMHTRPHTAQSFPSNAYAERAPDCEGRDWSEVGRELAALFAPRAERWDRDRVYCWDNIADLKEAGVMGMTLPTSLGGQGASWRDVCLVIEEVAKACTLTARIVVEANMGAVSAVMAYGSPAQKRLAARYVLAGDKPAICITEPYAGSAATQMQTT